VPPVPSYMSQMQVPPVQLAHLPNFVPPPPPVQYVPPVYNKRPKPPKPAAEENDEEGEFSCDACEKYFKTLQQHEAHLKSHVKCTYPGCNFNAAYSIVKLHKMRHLNSSIGKVDTPEEINRYIEERKKRFPTGEVVAKKVTETCLLYYYIWLMMYRRKKNSGGETEERLLIRIPASIERTRVFLETSGIIDLNSQSNTIARKSCQCLPQTKSLTRHITLAGMRVGLNGQKSSKLSNQTPWSTRLSSLVPKSTVWSASEVVNILFKDVVSKASSAHLLTKRYQDLHDALCAVLTVWFTRLLHGRSRDSLMIIIRQNHHC